MKVVEVTSITELASMVKDADVGTVFRYVGGGGSNKVVEFVKTPDGSFEERNKVPGKSSERGSFHEPSHVYAPCIPIQALMKRASPWKDVNVLEFGVADEFVYTRPKVKGGTYEPLPAPKVFEMDVADALCASVGALALKVEQDSRLLDDIEYFRTKILNAFHLPEFCVEPGGRVAVERIFEEYDTSVPTKENVQELFELCRGHCWKTDIVQKRFAEECARYIAFKLDGNVHKGSTTCEWRGARVSSFLSGTACCRVTMTVSKPGLSTDVGLAMFKQLVTLMRDVTPESDLRFYSREVSVGVPPGEEFPRWIKVGE